jgi:hypothetical protein
MILQYEKLWPSNPFIFYIPFQRDKKPIKGVLPNKVEFINTSSNIRDTILALCDVANNDEYVYWCIDDKYPIKLSVDELTQVYQNIVYKNLDNIDSFLLCRCKTLLEKKHVSNKLIKIKKISFLRRKTYTEIWLHQFIRNSVLKNIFSQLPKNIIDAKEMDEVIANLSMPSSIRLYVSSNSYMSFGESSSRGKITYNCFKSFKKQNIKIPSDMGISNREIFLGKRNPIFEKLLFGYGFINFYNKYLYRIYKYSGAQKGVKYIRSLLRSGFTY